MVLEMESEAEETSAQQKLEDGVRGWWSSTGWAVVLSATMSTQQAHGQYLFTHVWTCVYLEQYQCETQFKDLQWRLLEHGYRMKLIFFIIFSHFTYLCSLSFYNIPI